MGRRLPRSFFWIDQHLIRSGTWLRLSAEARLTYIAIAASCDRQGVSIWSRAKLMELAACKAPEEWGFRISELISHRLIELLPETAPPAIQLIELQPEQDTACGSAAPSLPPVIATPNPPPQVVVHTHTTIHLGSSKTGASSNAC
jgi:hypothetical protein